MAALQGLGSVDFRIGSLLDRFSHGEALGEHLLESLKQKPDSKLARALKDATRGPPLSTSTDALAALAAFLGRSATIAAAGRPTPDTPIPWIALMALGDEGRDVALILLALIKRIGDIPAD